MQYVYITSTTEKAIGLWEVAERIKANASNDAQTLKKVRELKQLGSLSLATGIIECRN